MGAIFPMEEIRKGTLSPCRLICVARPTVRKWVLYCADSSHSFLAATPPPTPAMTMSCDTGPALGRCSHRLSLTVIPSTVAPHPWAEL